MRPLSFLAPDFLEDPWPHYARFRAESPVWWSDEISMFCVFRYEDVQEALTSQAFTVEYPFRISRQILGTTLLDIDGPRHRELRRAVNPFLGPDRLDAFHASAAAAVIDSLLDGIAPGEFDFVEGFSKQVPIRVISRFLGLPPGDAPWIFGKMMYLIRHLVGSNGDFGKATAIRKEMEAYVRGLMAKEAGTGSAASLSPGMIASCLDSGMDAEEALRMALLFIAAGTETSTAALGNAMVCLLRHPDCLERVSADPGLVAGVILEALRWEPPQHDTVRFAARDTSLGGGAVPKGGSLKLLLASANRDESKFERAAEFVPGRPERAMLSFGSGPHACLGRNFATRELELALRKFLERFEVRSASAEATPIRGSTFRQPERVPLRIAYRGTGCGAPVRRKDAMTEKERITGCVREILAEALGADGAAPDPESGFFEAGGYSLLALTVINRINDRLGTGLPVTAILECRTLRDIGERAWEEFTRAGAPVPGREAPMEEGTL